MRHQPIPDSVEVIEDSTLPALSIMTLESADETFEHHMTVQRQ